MDAVKALVDRCRVARPSDTVTNSECVYTFFTPFHPQGILVQLHSFAGTIPSLAMKGSTLPQDLFLRIVKERSLKPKDEEKEAPQKLALGVPGGFDDDPYQVDTTYSVVVLDSNSQVVAEVPYDSETAPSTFPEPVVKSVESIIHHVGLAIQQDLTATPWQDDENAIPISKYCDTIPFIDNGVTISPQASDWKCEKTGATDNLWLNLSDGFIGGGRKNWDGSGGSNGALDHFQETGEQYPLVVKLGTITVEGDAVQADCYSYAKDEDGPVKIPNLAELLAKRGINVAALQKTAKSTAELEVELNANYAFDAITESGSSLVPVSGADLQGLQNLGNSCYLNSVIQVLSHLPEVASRYGTTSQGSVESHPYFQGILPKDAPFDLMVQTAKLVQALSSGVYSIPSDLLDSTEATTHPKYRLAPRMFKHLIGKDHVEFSTGQQQDAAQFLQHCLEKFDKAERTKDASQSLTSALFAFATQDRLVCSADQSIKYKKHAANNVWSLRVPMEKAKDQEPELKKQKQDEQEEPTPHLSLMDCVESWAAPSILDDYRWPHLNNAVHVATQTSGFDNFPRYLWLQLQRYELGPDWQPFKLKVNIDMEETIDLNPFRSQGPQSGEVLVPEEEASVPAKPSVDEGAVSQLMDMGFTRNGCVRALTATGGGDVEAAMNWIFEHNSDPDFNDPLPESSSAPASDSGADDAIVMSLVESLGCFTIDQVRAALKETNGAADRAADWLFSHMDDLDTAIAALQAKQAPSAAPDVPLEDGNGKYQLSAMVSHIGKNTGSGHYVAHIRRDGQWYIFNDEKVARSEHPPMEHAYMYLFQRCDTMGTPREGY
eukprot:Nitzschia sp. Nitz4//scaffold64_size103689//67382//69975//NITZ4_004441-RA/size103689-snap-gene-0.118-mRNA-1//1//CDS//3329556145//4115//frame0